MVKLLGKFHQKMLNRWAEIYLKKVANEGKQAADEYVRRTFTQEVIAELAPVLQRKRGK